MVLLGSGAASWFESVLVAQQEEADDLAGSARLKSDLARPVECGGWQPEEERVVALRKVMTVLCSSCC